MSADGKIVLGINASHDTACAAVVDGRVRVAIAEERLNRVKHCSGATPFGRIIPYRSIRYCCDELGVTPRDVERYVVNSCRRNAIEHLRAQLLGIDASRTADLPHPGHHRAHAYSAFYCSDFDEAAVLVVDTNGSFMERPGESPDALVLERKEHYTAFYGDANGLRTVVADFVGPGEVSLGELYCIYSAAMQLTPREGPYGLDCPQSAGGKLMGLASYDLGRTEAPALCALHGDHLEISLTRVVDHLERRGFVRRREPGLEGIFGFEMRPFVELERREGSLADERYISLAGEAQRALEGALIELARRLHAETGSKNLCLAGGTMLNVTATTRLLEDTPFERIFVQPAANDAGIAIGAALYGYRDILGGRARPYLREPYDTCLGRRYRDDEVVDAIARREGQVSARRLVSLQDKSEAILPRLMAGEIVGVFEGRSEFGPRALCHRSLLALPRDPAMREKMNALKHREWYRPVAPVVLEEDFADLFEAPFASVPFMTFSARCKQAVIDRAPAVCHVDGTARPQTVTADRSPLVHRLLCDMKHAGELPILVNTSLNVDGEPIVETPEHALDAFVSSHLMGAIVIDEHLVDRRT